MRVGTMMQTQLITATPEMSLAEVQRLMRDNNIRHVPVVSGQRLVGIMTDRDVLEASPSPATTLTHGEIAYRMETTPIKTCMTKDVVCIGPDIEMEDAARLLLQWKVGCLPVVSGQRLVGIITDRDVREASPSPATTLTRGEIAYRMDTTPVKTCMTRDVVWIGPNLEMVDAARLLLQRRVGCLPVVDHSTLVGIVTDMDCLRAFLETASGA